MKTRQRGVAIVLAMGVVAMATLAVTAMLVAQSTWARQVELGADHVQAQLVIQAGLDWARAVLGDDRRNGLVDHLGEPWALRLPPIPVENGSVSGHIEDQQSRFNLNNLLGARRDRAGEVVHFRRLLFVLGLRPDLADVLVAWMDRDGGAGDTAVPARASVRALVDATDLALVPGFDAAARTRLLPFVTALPRSTPVNVNTASAEVLHAVIDGLSLEGARVLVAQRERIYFRDFADFFGRLPPGLVVPNDSVAVGSDYFLAAMVARRGEAEAQGSALLVRKASGWPATVWRRYP